LIGAPARRLIGSLALLLTAFVFVRRASFSEPLGGLHILVPDDAGGLPIRLMLLSEEDGQDILMERQEEIIPTSDCCSSAAQWAMSWGGADIAALCPDAAASLVEKDPRYFIVGAFLYNSDVLVTRSENSSSKKAVMQNRGYQRDLLADRIASADIVPMLPAGIVYALEKGFIGGGVMDALMSWEVRGEKKPLATSGDVSTYVLVASKEFASSPAFDAFVLRFDRAIDELSTYEGLKNAVFSYAGLQWSKEDAELWKKLRIRFQKISR
jgi:hypothetical protein